MNNYVDINLLIKKRHGCDRTCCDCDFYKDGDSWCQGEIYFIDILREAKKTAEVKKVVRGTWIGIDEFPHEDWECSICGEQVCGNDSIPQDMNFCPNCGADMRGANNG